MERYAIMQGEVPDDEAEKAALAESPEDVARTQKFNTLRSWLEHERDRQAENRFEMAKDGDFYDGLQWSEKEALEIESRGQAPLVFNEVKVAIDWILGTEKRNRVDWKVLPREKSDHDAAVTKTKVMKYVSDVNRVPYVRSAAFGEAVISGLGWLEDGISQDATEDILYAGTESWRNILHDSYHKRNDGRDMRYLFRWRHIDLDIAEALFPDHRDELRRAAMEADQLTSNDDEELWYLGEPLRPNSDAWRNTSARRHLHSTISAILSARRRVKVYDCWYREPQQVEVVTGGPYNGELFDPRNTGQMRSLASGMAEVLPRLILRVRVAIMTDGALLEDEESPFKHNDFPFTPIYCFRRQRDGMAYGHVRPMRDAQLDLNKRMSKSLFLLSVNQLIVDENTFAKEGDYTLQDAIDNVANPNGVFVKRTATSTFEIRRDYAEIQQQLEMVNLDRQFMQSGSGVTNELMGRQTNAVSGRAITARQEQGSTTTSGVFDNYRHAISLSGQKQLSNAEKFYTLPKVIRLTEPKNAKNENTGLDWVTLNEPVLNPDGSVEFLNDITATKADFIVDEQDFKASMRTALFEQMLGMMETYAKVNPQLCVDMLPHVIDLADFPGKEEWVAKAQEIALRAAGKPTDPQEAAAAAEQAELAKRAAAAKIAVDEAKADKTDAEADNIRVGLPPNGVATDLATAQQPAPGVAPAVGGAPQPGMPGAPAPGMPGADPNAVPGAGAPPGGPLPSLAGGQPAPGMAPSQPGMPAIPGGVQAPGVPNGMPGASFAPAAHPAGMQTSPSAPAAVGAPSMPVAAPAPTTDPAVAEAANASAAALEAVSTALQIVSKTQADTVRQLGAMQQQMAVIGGVLEATIQTAIEADANDEPAPAPAAAAAEQKPDALAALLAQMQQLTSLVQERTTPRAKTIRLTGPDGEPIEAVIQPTGNGSKNVTLNRRGKPPVTAEISAE